MPFYKDTKTPPMTYWLDDAIHRNLIPADCVEITQAEYATLSAPAPVAPTFVDLTPRQIRMALTRVGLRASIEGAIAAGTQDMKDWWAYSQVFQRTHPLVLQMGTSLGQTSAQLDALWTLGGTL
jgi:hypothetical protein